MSPPVDREQQDHAGRFIETLQHLTLSSSGVPESGSQRAALAALRRGLGKPAGTTTEMYRYVLPCLPARSQPDIEATYFLVASLFALHPRQWTDQGARSTNNLGASFYLLQQRTARPSIEQRFVALLDAPVEALPNRLRQAISLLRAEEIPVNYAQLLRDLLRWGWDHRPVQRAWARAYWGSGQAEVETPAESAAEMADA